jgi:hypothetical protein
VYPPSTPTLLRAAPTNRQRRSLLLEEQYDVFIAQSSAPLASSAELHPLLSTDMPKQGRASSPSISPELVRLIQQVCPAESAERPQGGRANCAGRLQRNVPTATAAAAGQAPVQGHADYRAPKSPSIKVGMISKNHKLYLNKRPQCGNA